MFDLFMKLTTFLRSVISWPYRIIKIAFAVPNFKILFKSGHCEKVFLKNIVYLEGKHIKWTSCGAAKKILTMDFDEIIGIFQLY